MPDPTPIANTGANELDLEAGELEALAPAPAPAEPTDPPAPDTPPGPAPAAADPAPPVAHPEPAPAAATEPVVAAPPAPFVPQYTADAKDFAGEIAATNQALLDLKQRYKSGEEGLTEEVYETQFDLLQQQRVDLTLAKGQAELTASLNQQNADQQWQYLQRQFLSGADNVGIATNPMLFAAWESGMQLVVNEAAAEGRQLTDWDMMVGARQKLVEAGMLTGATAAPAAPAPAATPPAKPDRSPPMQDVPATLSGVPAAADPGTRTTAENLADNNIEDVEDWLAGKSEAERDRILSAVPGAVVQGS